MNVWRDTEIHVLSFLMGQIHTKFLSFVGGVCVR